MTRICARRHTASTYPSTTLNGHSVRGLARGEPAGMRPDVDYLAHLARESARFAEVIAEVPADARVPSCPDWNADDLLWHLGEVQWFWGTIVRERLTGEQAEQRKPPRPAGRASLLAFYRRANGDLK